MARQTYADYLTAQRSKKRLENARFVKCVNCNNLNGKRCGNTDLKVSTRAFRVCRDYRGP